MHFEDDFCKVIKYVNEKNHAVEITKNSDNDYFYPESKRIVIQYRDNDFKTMLLYLLHETGHLINHLDWQKSNEDWSKKYPKYTLDSKVNDDIEYSKDWFQVSTIFEENLAWSAGKELIFKLNLSLSPDDFDLEWTDAIKAYILHSASILKNQNI